MEKISISKTPSALTLVDLAVPANGTCAREGAVRIERKIDAAAAEGVRRLSVVNGWSSDTVYAAAWMVVRDLVLGMSEVTLHEHDEKWPGPTVATSIHRLSPDAISRDWIAQFEHDRQLGQPRQDTTFVEDIDHIWLKRDATISPPSFHAPNQFDGILTIGVSGDAAPSLTAAFSEAVFDRSIIESLLDATLQVVTSFVGSPEIPIGAIDILGKQQRALFVALESTASSLRFASDGSLLVRSTSTSEW